ncbi:MAG: DUF1570 domain-containing protein [Planctomycetes bacterium]|nr:DUF1570 domain-containing protein [Planctomycetota bacterium]
MIAKSHAFLTLAVLALLGSTSTLGAQDDRIRPGKWTSKSQWPEGWIVYESPHYQIQSQVGKDKAKRLANHMEAMFRLYKKVFPPGKDGFIKKPVKLFKDQASFQAYSGVGGGTLAYYMSAPNRELVGYDTGVWQDEKKPEGPTTGKLTRKEIMDRLLKREPMDFLGVMSHEGWHQYFHWYVVSMLQLPSWINEGMGDYFYCAVPPYGAKGRDAKVKLGRLNDARLPTIRVAVKQNRHVPWKKIIRYAQSDYYAQPGLCYAQGWAMCHFLMEHKDRKYNSIIPTFIRLVKDDGNIEACTDQAFRGIDIDALEEEWKAWVLQTKLPADEKLEQMLDDLDKEETEGQPAGGGGSDAPSGDGGGIFPVDPNE